jgi:ppGpp synthetase/RelA/SpoT-type nucleotidyltranferase
MLEKEVSNRMRTILMNITKTLDHMLRYKYIFEEKDATEKRHVHIAGPLSPSRSTSCTS